MTTRLQFRHICGEVLITSLHQSTYKRNPGASGTQSKEGSGEPSPWCCAWSGFCCPAELCASRPPCRSPRRSPRKWAALPATSSWKPSSMFRNWSLRLFHFLCAPCLTFCASGEPANMIFINLFQGSSKITPRVRSLSVSHCNVVCSWCG